MWAFAVKMCAMIKKNYYQIFFEKNQHKSIHPKQISVHWADFCEAVANFTFIQSEKHAIFNLCASIFGNFQHFQKNKTKTKIQNCSWLDFFVRRIKGICINPNLDYNYFFYEKAVRKFNQDFCSKNQYCIDKISTVGVSLAIITSEYLFHDTHLIDGNFFIWIKHPVFLNVPY